MKKTAIVIFICILVTVFVVSVTAGEKIISFFSNVFTSNNRSGEIMSIIESNKELNTGLNELNAYDYSKFVFYGTPRKVVTREGNALSNISSKLLYIQDYDKIFPIQHVEVIDDDTLCVVYKLEENGETEYRYVIFNRQDIKYEHNKETSELWICYGEQYCAKAGISLGDYSNLKKGEKVSVSDLAKFAIHADNSPVTEIDEKTDTITREDVCILKEGLLLIKFKGEINGELFELMEIELIPYGNNSGKYPSISILHDKYLPSTP